MSEHDLMDVLGDGLDVDNTEPMQDGFQPLPAGWYPAEIEKAELRPTKNGMGMKTQFCVIGDNYANRKLFGFINIKNTHPTCERIGQAELASMGKAAGISGVLRSTTELIGRTLDLRVVVESERNSKGEFDNEIKAYAPIGTGGSNAAAPVAARSVSPPAATPVAPAAALPVAGKKPWER